jgi:hypothetical protein
MILIMLDICHFHRERAYLFSNHSTSSSMSKVQIIEMADKCLGVLLRQVLQIGGICSAGS